MTTVQSLNITLGEQSPVYTYLPQRDGPKALGWNASYSESPTWPLRTHDIAGAGTPYRVTENNGSSIVLTFEGTAIYMCLAADTEVTWQLSVTPNAAVREVVAHSDPVCGQWGGSILAIADSLPYNTYTATLQVKTVPSGSVFEFFGSVVGVSIGPPGTAAGQPVIIDDASPDWVYQPPNEWNRVADVDAVDGGYSQTCWYDAQQIASANYTTTNVSALWIVGRLSAVQGVYSVQLNDSPVETYNASNFWSSEQEVLYFVGGLDPTQRYTVQVENYDPGYLEAPPDDENCILVDAIYLIQGGSANGTASSSGASTPSSVSPEPSSTAPVPLAAIIGGVVGGIVGLLVVCGVALLLFRRRKTRFHAVQSDESKIDDPLSPALASQSVPTPYFDTQSPLPPEPSLIHSRQASDDITTALLNSNTHSRTTSSDSGNTYPRTSFASSSSRSASPYGREKSPMIVHNTDNAIGEPSAIPFPSSSRAFVPFASIPTGQHPVAPIIESSSAQAVRYGSRALPAVPELALSSEDAHAAPPRYESLGISRPPDDE